MFQENADSWHPSVRLDDAKNPTDLLDCYGLWARWPEPRVLEQTRLWIQPDRSTSMLADLDDSGLRSVLHQLRDQASMWHSVAVQDELATLSSAVSWAYRQVGIRLVADVHPLVWLDSTDLVRHLLRLLHPCPPA